MLHRTTLVFFLLSATLFSNAQIFSENFDDITLLTDWDRLNVSEPLGSKEWSQGSGVLGPHSGASTSYLATNYDSTTGVGTISNWLILPVLSLKDGDTMTFYTISLPEQYAYPDRLQVRLSSNGASSVAPTNSTDVGDYTTVILEINPTLAYNVYPISYTQYEAVISGVGSTATDVRLAFRYYATDAGPDGNNASGIGIDSLVVSASLPTLGSDELKAESFDYFYNNKTQDLTFKSANSTLNHIKIFNTLGQEVANKKLSTNNSSINLSHLNNDVYFAKIKFNDSFKTIKFLKH